MYNDKMYNIFLCYRRGAGSQGSLLAARLYDELGSIEGFKPFYAPQVVEPGDNFRHVSLNAIAGVKVFILLLTPGFFDECSNDDDPVRAEIQTTLDDQHIRFISICLPGFDAAQEFTKSVRACFQGAFADRIEHIAYAQCSDPKSFNVADVLEKPIRKLFCLYDDEKREQGASTTQTKGEDIADDRLTIENGVLVKCDKKAKGDLIIPYGVTSIGDSAFESCDSLTSVTIGNGVTSIGSSAFLGCTSLTSITIPGSVTSIGEDAFFSCDSLTSIVIPDSVTSIGRSAFEDCTSLTSITIGNGVTSIGEDAFWHCDSLTSITIPDSVTSIGSYAFRNCKAEIIWGGTPAITEIGDNAFEGYAGTSITIPGSVTSIGDYAFYDCDSLTSVTIPDSVTSIGGSAFRYCYKLVEVYNKSPLVIATGSEDNGYVGYYAEHVYTEEGGSWLTDTEDGFRFFYDGETGYLVGYLGNETELTLPESFTAYDGTVVSEYQINDYAFEGCTSLTSVTIPDSVTSIGSCAFRNCKAEIIWGGTPAITEIGDNAFKGYAGTSITIPGSVTSIGDYAFYDCTSLSSVTIGNGVTSIGDYAFSHCTSLTSVTIPDSVKSIGSSAFSRCTSLTSVTIGNSVTSIGGYAFQNCTSLTAVRIPDSVTSIGRGVFCNCASLTSVNIGNGVKSIGHYAFYNCCALTSVTFKGTVAEWNRIAMEEDEDEDEDEGCWDDWFEGCEVEEIKCVNGRTAL